MNKITMTTRRRGAAAARLVALAAGVCWAAAPAAAQGTSTDPRVGLSPGYANAGQAARGMRLVVHRDNPQGFFNPQDRGDFGFANSDMAFRGNLLFMGGYAGWQVWDISNPASPRVRATHPCAGGQGDVSVYGDLLFMSVEETRGRVDCGQGAGAGVRFRGVRIFDISNLDRPRQIASVQTCRGSHTHTLLAHPTDRQNLYVYVQGTGGVRPATELAGCTASATDPATSLFRIEVIQVPLARPQDARVVSMPRVFADPRTGSPAGLWPGGAHGQGTQESARTDQCHDITVYPAIGLAAGACAGNGILLDIRDPANPVRVEEVSDPNFAYWHSATFNNDGSKVLFTDEWGGGASPRCRATDRREWGADAIFTLSGRDLTHRGYYKLPAAQTEQENCVAHNGSLVPVPGRDLMVQAWYQGGISVFDFTDPANPVEVAFFDRGPLSATESVLGGFWSAYWYNGHIYGTEITRGLDVLTLTPSPLLTQNELDAAALVRYETFNPQMQPRVTWPAHFSVAKAYADQLGRGGIRTTRAIQISRELDRAQRLRGNARRTALTALATQLDSDAGSARDAAKVRALAAVVRELAR